jgi:hypothetical protein
LVRGAPAEVGDREAPPEGKEFGRRATNITIGSGGEGCF